MLSSFDDFPVHQTHEPVRFVATSDRNFYDRYYFNLHGSSDELFMVIGMGQYPNLAVQDAFACVQRGSDYRVVRASRELGDRMDTSVGPFRIEVVKPLEELRFVLEETEHGIAADLRFRGSIPAVEEPTQFIRRKGRVFFQTSRPVLASKHRIRSTPSDFPWPAWPFGSIGVSRSRVKTRPSLAVSPA